jgi:hypothetical protein
LRLLLLRVQPIHVFRLTTLITHLRLTSDIYINFTNSHFRHNRRVEASSVIRSAPRALVVGDDPTVTRHLDEELIAVSGDPAGTTIATFADENLTVTPVASVRPENHAELVGPVYRGPGGELAVPTGRVLVRFGSGDEAKAHAGAISDAGFQLDEVPRYAPQAAWVLPVSGGVTAALSGIERLQNIPGVEHVEPQVLMAAARRLPDDRLS